MTYVTAFLALSFTSAALAAPVSDSTTNAEARPNAPSQRESSPVVESQGNSALHVEIDRLFEADTLVPLLAQADDAEFLRRVTLDLHGIIPIAAEVRAFLADQSPSKRHDLIDRLLADPRFARHMATTFDVLWLERKPDKNIPRTEWYEYLYRSFLDEKPFDQLAREILSGDDLQPTTKPATKFYHVRLCEPHLVTRDIGRLFFGMDMQCNQCHDHPTIDDYTIADYHGLYAFVNRTYVYKDKKKGEWIGEKPEGKANFKSAFTGESSDKVTPRVPRGAAVVEPVYKKGEEYAVAPDAKDAVKPVPKFSRRAALAEKTVDASSTMFDRNIVNRLWAHLFGRGLVHPVDFHHPANPPSHPEVLDLLAREFRAHGCDVKYILRELALTRTYDRSCELPIPQSLQADVVAKRLAAWKQDLAKLDHEFKNPKQTDAAYVRRLTTARKAKQKSVEEVILAAEYLNLAKSDPKRAVIKWEALLTLWNVRGDVPLLKPLTPEAFAASILQTTGALGSAADKARVSLAAQKPKEWTDAEPAQRPRIEAMLIDKQTFDPLEKNMQPLVTMYSDVPGGEFGATLNQALFFGNGGVVELLLKAPACYLTDRTTKMTDSTAVADELYLSVLSRYPTKEDVAAVAAFLKDRKDRAAAIQEMIWGMMASMEFRFNH